MTLTSPDRSAHTLSLLELENQRLEEAIFPDGLTGSCFECGAPMAEPGICPRCDTALTRQAPAPTECAMCGRLCIGGACARHDPWTETWKELRR